MKKCLIVMGLVFFAMPALASEQVKESQFYDFGEQVIDGQIKTPGVTVVDQKQRVKFDRLLKLKKSFITELTESGKDSALR